MVNNSRTDSDRQFRQAVVEEQTHFRAMRLNCLIFCDITNKNRKIGQAAKYHDRA